MGKAYGNYKESNMGSSGTHQFIGGVVKNIAKHQKGLKSPPFKGSKDRPEEMSLPKGKAVK